MFSKILVPVDGSDNSSRALDHALFLADKVGSHVSILYVMEPPPTVYVQSQKVLEDIMAKYRKESSAILNKAKEKASGKSDIEIEMLEGDPPSAILNYAAKGHFDMIVMGSRGMGKLKEMMLGSTSSKVLHHAPCSVLVVK